MSFWVEKDGSRFPFDTPLQEGVKKGSIWGGRWTLHAQFSSVKNATDAAQGWLRDHTTAEDCIYLAVVDEDGLEMWGMCSCEFGREDQTSEGSEVQMQPDLQNPLNISREALINQLQSNLDAETKTREEKQAREAQARISVLQFVTDHEDEIVQWIGAGAPGGFGSGSWESIAQNLERFFQDNDYTPKNAKPTQRENDLEKFVRVLTMASDDTVEVKPNQPIYDLL